MSLKVDIEKQLNSFKLKACFEISSETVSIFGFSGAGKSMTLKCIAGIEEPDCGYISLNGRVLYDSNKGINLSPQERCVGYLFQDYALFPNMTVEQNIAAGMRIKDSSTIEKWLMRYDLEGCRNSYPSELSGGQKQRTAVARMLASEPKCLLLDEPFSALDVQMKWRLEQELAEVLETVDKPAIIVSHNREEVYRLSKRVCCIEQGRMSALRETDAVFRSPITKLEAVLSGCENITAARRIDEQTYYVEDWNQYFRTDRKDIQAVGIHKSNLYVEPISDYFIEISECRIQHEIDGSVLVCRVRGRDGRLQCKIDCNDTAEYRRLYYKPDDLILLE